MDALGPIVGRLTREMLGFCVSLGMIGVAFVVYAIFSGRFSWEAPDISFESAIGAIALTLGLVGWVRLFKRLGTRLHLLLRGHGRA